MDDIKYYILSRPEIKKKFDNKEFICLVDEAIEKLNMFSSVLSENEYIDVFF